MANYEAVFHPDGYNSPEYRSLNYSYQNKMAELFSHRRIDYPAKELQFEIETVKISSTMTQRQYLKLQSLVESFPETQRSGAAPVIGKDDYQSIILYHDYRLFDSTQYVVRSPVGFGYTVSKLITITSEPAEGPHHQVKVTLAINPNRFVDVPEEPLLRLVIEEVLPLMVTPQISEMDLTLDMPLIMNNFHVQMGGQAGTKQQITQRLNDHQEYELSRIAYVDPQQTRKLIVADKFQSLLDNQLLVADTDYISAREAEYYRDQVGERQFLTRIELAVTTPNAVMRYMKNHEWLMRDISIEYRDNSGISRFAGTDYATNGKDFRRSFNRMLTYRLKEVQRRARKLPYLTDAIWRNTLK